MTNNNTKCPCGINENECKNKINCPYRDKDARNRKYKNTFLNKNGEKAENSEAISDGSQKAVTIIDFIKNPIKTIKELRTFKIILIIMFLLVGCYSLITKQSPWSKLNIVMGENYDAKLSNGKYYIDTQEDNITLNFGVAREIKEIYIIEDLEGTTNKKTYKVDEPLEVNIYDNAEYILGVVYIDGKTEEVKFLKQQ